MPGISGTLYDETYDLDIEAGTAYELALPYATLFDLGFPPPPLLFAPLVIFVAPPRLAEVVSTLDVLTWVAPAHAAAVVAVARSLTFTAPARVASVISTMDILTWVAPSRPSAIAATLRGGG